MMATFQKSSSMSDDSAYRLAKMLFGLDRGEFDIVLNKLNERYFEPIARFASDCLKRGPFCSKQLRGNFMRSCRKSRRLPQYQVMKSC
jgi:hypothetical protein